jgi:hypothetical protein
VALSYRRSCATSLPEDFELVGAHPLTLPFQVNFDIDRSLSNSFLHFAFFIFHFFSFSFSFWVNGVTRA